MFILRPSDRCQIAIRKFFPSELLFKWLGYMTVAVSPDVQVFKEAGKPFIVLIGLA
jgi:hypothetical protein